MMLNTHPTLEYSALFCFFFHSPVLFHQKWTEMIDTGYRAPWGERWDFPRPRLQNSKTGNCFPTCQCAFTDTDRFNTFFHIYYIFTVIIVNVKVYFVLSTSALTEPRVVMLSGQVTTHSLLCSAVIYSCDLLRLAPSSLFLKADTSLAEQQ